MLIKTLKWVAELEIQPSCNLLRPSLLLFTTLPSPVHRLIPEFLFEQRITELDEESEHGPVILRRKRAAAKEKNTCQLFIQTDHFFYKYYGTREAVVAQVYRGHLRPDLRPDASLFFWNLSMGNGCSGSNGALFLQISSHIKAINSIYQVTDFKGIRNISFMVKRIRVG